MGGVRDPLGRGLKAGTELGASRWVDVDQGRIDKFASATEDSQWIHTARISATVERDGHPKPVCVAELVFRFLR